MDIANNKLGVSIDVTGIDMDNVGDKLPAVVDEAIKSGKGKRIVSGKLVATNGDCHKK
jgi:hypothetical protein